MHVYSFSEAKQNFSSMLDQAKEDGAVQIATKDGRLFMVTAVTPEKSPPDITGVDLNLTSDEIVEFVREGRDKI